jgi:hypothetical protein
LVGVKKAYKRGLQAGFDIPQFLRLLFANCEMRREEAVEERITEMIKK